jgi:metallo-beta-lactamase family protein
MRNFKSKPKMVFTVHGEDPSLSIYAANIQEQMGWNVTVPKYLEEVDLFKGI